jgi:hypothetical protein
VNEPICVLTQESLAQIGIKTTINKIPGATWRTELNKKVMPLYTNVFSAGSTIRSTSSSGAITARIRSSTP